MITATNRKWWILAGMSTSLALGFLDMTAVAVSLPQIQKMLHSSSTMLQWVVNAYLLAIAVFLILGGQLGDNYGHRRIYIIGAFIFMLASLLCALSINTWMLVLSRVLQGIGSALTIPSVAVIMFNTFPITERGKAMGIYVGCASGFLAFGPLLGGVLTQWFSWRMVFWINLPLILISILVAAFIVPKDIAHKKKIDWLGFLLGGIGIALLVISCMSINAIYSHTILVSAEFIISLLFIGLFFWYEGHSNNPIVDIKIFRDKFYLGCLIAVFVMQFTFMSFVFRAIWFQDVLGYSPADAGLLTLPGTLPVLLISPIAGRMLDKHGIMLPCCLGFILTILGMFAVGATIMEQNYWSMLPGMLCLGVGIPLTMSPAMAGALLTIDPAQRGMAAGTFNTFRQIGSTIGLAILGTIMTIAYNTSLTRFFSINHFHIKIKQIDGILSGSSSARAAIKHLTPAEQTALYHSAKYAYSFALSMVTYLCAILLVIGFFIMIKFLRTAKKIILIDDKEVL